MCATEHVLSIFFENMFCTKGSAFEHILRICFALTFRHWVMARFCLLSGKANGMCAIAAIVK